MSTKLSSPHTPSSARSLNPHKTKRSKFSRNSISSTTASSMSTGFGRVKTVNITHSKTSIMGATYSKYYRVLLRTTHPPTKLRESANPSWGKSPFTSLQPWAKFTRGASFTATSSQRTSSLTTMIQMRCGMINKSVSLSRCSIMSGWETAILNWLILGWQCN